MMIKELYPDHQGVDHNDPDKDMEHPREVCKWD